LAYTLGVRFDFNVFITLSTVGPVGVVVDAVGVVDDIGVVDAVDMLLFYYILLIKRTKNIACY